MEGRPAPDRNDEYLLYQTLVGTWPLLPPSPEEAVAFVSRIQQYMFKAAREAKLHTSWVNPNDAYDEALRSFVAKILAPGPGNRFLADFAVFHPPVARLGMVNSLAQTLLKITAPGVPDFYQGTEVWDFSLVDPDNRRPVDFSARVTLLADLRERIATGDLGAAARELLSHWEDGRVKMYVIHRGLECRRRRPELFRTGDYLPLPTGGAGGDHVLAFARRHATAVVVTVIPRLTAALTGEGTRLPVGPDVWRDAWVELPPGCPATSYTDVFTGAVATVTANGGRRLRVGTLLADLPVALLESGPDP